MYILGLNIGHNATACLLKDGKIVGCVSEERFARKKNVSGLPFKSIKHLLDSEKIDCSEIDKVVLDGHYVILEQLDYSDKFLGESVNKGLKKRILGFLGYKYPLLFRRYYNFKNSFFKKSSEKKVGNYLIENISKKMNISKNKISIIDHHLSHALSTCFNLDNKEKTLIFTLDGEGSGICATVSIWDGKKIERISASDKTASLGYLYGHSTIYLGMRPLEHEFKVMGLAPYAKEYKVKEIYEKFKDIIWINENLEFKSKFNMVFADCFLKEKMNRVRFDVVAGFVQKMTEEKIIEWIKKSIRKTGIHNIALSGGVFMNVRANQRIYELPEVKNLFVMPSCGDEANAIGACFYGYRKYCEETQVSFNPCPIKDLYLGPEYSNDYIENMMISKKLGNKYKIRKLNNINKEVAMLLAKGNIVARCSGKSEWGARALGNRSILSNASNSDTIRILNETIKDRDFWMPFTPSIIDKFEKKYVINPKKMFAPYMCITFNSTEQAKKDIPAAMHPYDQTLRPQIVLKDWNPDYYEIINEYSRLTGKGGILNTSFNLHGEPNVLTPEDALHTVENSDLKYLAMEDYLFEKLAK